MPALPGDRTAAAATLTGLAQRLGPGRAAFNRGAFFEAHELWEDVWRPLSGAERTVVQGLIQIAAGLHHLAEQRPRPAVGLLRKGLAKISRGVPVALAQLPVEVLASAVAVLLTELTDLDALAVPGATVPKATGFRL